MLLAPAPPLCRGESAEEAADGLGTVEVVVAGQDPRLGVELGLHTGLAGSEQTEVPTEGWVVTWWRRPLGWPGLQGR